MKEALNAFFKSFASSANIYMLAIFCLLGNPQSPMNRPLRWSGCAAFCRFLALPGNEKNKNPAFGTCENRLFDAYPLRGFFMGTSVAVLKKILHLEGCKNCVPGAYPLRGYFSPTHVRHFAKIQRPQIMENREIEKVCS